MSLPPREHPDDSPPRGVYGAVLLAVGVAALARWSLVPVLGDAVPFATFFAAVVFAAWRGGLYPALLAIGLGFGLTVMLFPSAEDTITGLPAGRILAWGLYFAVSGAIAGFGEAMWRARRRLQRREEAARAQAQLLQVTFASIGDAVITTDAAGGVTYLNPLAERLTGYTSAEARGVPMTEVFRIVNEQTRAPVENPVDKVLALGQTVGLANHTILIARDGHEYAIDDSGAPIRDHDGRIIGVVLVFRDVTERKRAEDATYRQAAILRAISDGTPDLVYVRDTAGRLRFANPATLALLGLPAQAAIGADPAAVMVDDAERESALTSDRRVMAADASVVVEEPYTTSQGRRTFLAAKSPMRDEAGTVVGVIGISRDITERRDIEERLQESEARFRTLADALPQIVYVSDSDGRVTFINQRWRDYTGQMEAQQADLVPLVHPEDLPALTALWQHAAATGTPLTAEFRLRRASDGAYRWFLTRSLPGFDDDRRVLRWYGTSTDIHDQKLAEERTRASEARQAFLVALGDALRPVGDPIEAQEVASRLLGEHLRATRVVYFEVAGDRYRVLRDYARGVPTLRGEHPAAAFGPRVLALYQRGQMVSEADVRTAPGIATAERDAFERMASRAYVGVPLVKDGAFVAGLSVHDAQPRHWTAGEIALVQDAAERTWAAVERARVESALVTSEARFRTLFETMDEGFCVIEVIFDGAGRAVDYRLLELNPAFGRHTGLHGALGRTARDLTPGLEEFWYDAYGRVATTGESVRFVQQAQPLDGRWFEVYAFRLGGDGSSKVAILFQDVTARTVASAAASRRSEQVRRLAEVLPRISATTDIRSIMGVVTGEARRIVDAHQANAIHVSGDDWANALMVTSLSDKYGAWREFHQRPTGQGIYSLVAQHNTPLRLTQAELERHPAFHGFAGHRPAHPPLNGLLAVPLVGRDGMNMGVIQLSDKLDGEFTADDEAVLMQVGQMGAVAIDNARLVADLQLADRRKDEFLSVLAHELRNPLAPIRNGLHLMKVAHDDARIVGRAREIVDRQVTQMVRLIDDLMDLTRISRGKLMVQKAPVALADVLRIAVETSQPIIEQAGHAFTLDVPDAPILVEADETRLAQVFANLLNNAAKYTMHGGRVGLSVRRDGDEVHIAVEDTGVGIPAAMLGHIFDMFTQVDRSLEKAQGGLGIGLNIARRLVEKHGGRLTAESGGEGQGSRFVVSLPVADSSAVAAVAPPDGEPAPAGPPRRVLVVDDNVDAATSLSLMLRAMGHETRTASDGREAVAAVEEFRPDLVLMDIGMPNLNGYDACRQMRQLPWTRDLVIAACTGWGQDDDRQSSREAGFDLHLVKPPSPSALQQLVAGLDGRPRAGGGQTDGGASPPVC